MPTYAETTDFEAYVEGWVTDNAQALERLLERAEADIDAALGNVNQGGTGGRMYDPAHMPGWTSADGVITVTGAQQATALLRATCAQAEYRFAMGEEHFVKGQYDRVRGPEFETQGTLPVLAPKAQRELAGFGLDQTYVFVI